MWGLRVGFARAISLVQYFRQEKAEIAAIDEESAHRSQTRSKRAKARLEREKAGSP
ncbi:hypothetical protein ACLK1S_10245 [Escherichia coli]